ncbi:MULTISPECIES: TcpD family membrane protein [Bacillus cereus group]
MYMLDMMNYFVLGMGLEGVFEEAKTQGTYALYIVFIFIGVYLGFKRAWTLFASLVVGGGALVFFINKPDALKAIGTFLGGLVGL